MSSTLDVKSLTLLAMCLGLFMPQLDTTVVNLALPSMERSLHAGVSALQWIIDGYNLTFASLLLLGGILGDIFGRKKMFLTGLVIFILGSLLCGFAPGFALLLSGRVLQGVGAALELPVTLSILTVTYADPSERAGAIGIWGSVAGMALAIGPTAGAFLIVALGWQSIFFLNLPIGLFTLALAVRSVRESSHPQGRRLDIPGQLLAILFLLLLTYAVIEGKAWGWRSPLILGSLGLALCSLIAFVVVEHRTSGAMVPLDVFRRSTFSAALAMAFMMTFGMYGMFFLVSLYLQSLTHASALLAGLQIAPLSLGFIVISSQVGRLMGRIGPRPLTAAGMTLMGSGLFLLLFLTPDRTIWFLLLVMGVTGIGIGLNMGPVLAVAMSSIPPERSGMASGLGNVARMVGATLGVAVLGAIFAANLANGHGSAAFLAGLHNAFLVGGCVELLGAAIALRYMPRTIGAIGAELHGLTRSRGDRGGVTEIEVPEVHKPLPECCVMARGCALGEAC